MLADAVAHREAGTRAFAALASDGGGRDGVGEALASLSDRAPYAATACATRCPSSTTSRRSCARSPRRSTKTPSGSSRSASAVSVSATCAASTATTSPRSWRSAPGPRASRRAPAVRSTRRPSSTASVASPWPSNAAPGAVVGERRRGVRPHLAGGAVEARGRRNWRWATRTSPSKSVSRLTTTPCSVPRRQPRCAAPATQPAPAFGRRAAMGDARVANSRSWSRRAVTPVRSPKARATPPIGAQPNIARWCSTRSTPDRRYCRGRWRPSPHILGADHQVLAVTHLPQVAALARTQVVVTKEVRDGKTFASAARSTRRSGSTSGADAVGHSDRRGRVEHEGVAPAPK